MDNSKIKTTESPEKRAQIKICVIIAFIQTITALVNGSYANLFLLIAVMSFAYLVANTDDFFLVWDSAKDFISKRGKNSNIGDITAPVTITKEQIEEYLEDYKKEHPEQFEEVQEFSDPVADKGSVEVPVKEKTGNNNSVIWANNTN